MPTNFPISLDTFINPGANQKLGLSAITHDLQHGNANDAIAALEAKVGINGSSVTSSLDYKVNNPAAAQAYCLDWPGVGTVSHGFFWQQNVNMPAAFWWDVACMPRNASSTYVISDGSGGAHALLFGFAGGGFITNQFGNPNNFISGNVYDSGTQTTFGGDDGLFYGEWGVISVAWNGSNIVCYVDGVPVGITPWVGPRFSNFARQGELYVGGSDHSNFNGRIAAIRGFDTTNPVESSVTAASAASVFMMYPFQGIAKLNDGSIVPCNFLADYTVPGRMMIPDMSPIGKDFGTGPQLHPGFIQAIDYGAVMPAALGFPHDATASNSALFGPSYVADSTFPWMAGKFLVGPAASALSPKSVPGGAKIFDSFGRVKSVYTYGFLTNLGSTEGGSVGSVVWNAPSSFGIPIWGLLHASPVLLLNTRARMWVTCPSADMDVRVNRRSGRSFGMGQATGIVFRLQDNSNYWQYSSEGNGSLNVVIQRVEADTQTFLSTQTPSNSSWVTLRVVASGTTLTFYTDDGGSGWVQVLQLTSQTVFQTAVNAGICSGVLGGNIGNGLDRFYNFTVF